MEDTAGSAGLDNVCDSLIHRNVSETSQVTHCHLYFCWAIPQLKLQLLQTPPKNQNRTKLS